MLGSGAAVLASQTVSAQPPDALQQWLAAHAVPIRTIDAADEDFIDLEPLAGAVGAARVVQLGEPSHGAGASFAAKARLCKFLHQRMGFDVLVWESGLYDVELTRAGMRSEDSAIAAARRGIFSLWSEAEEVRPLFEYVKASQGTVRPFDMAGYDLQVTANGSTDRFAADLRAFASAPRDIAVRSVPLAERAIESRRRLFASNFAEGPDFEDLSKACGALLDLIRRERKAFEAARGEETAAFMERAVENMRVDALQRYESARAGGQASVERENRRDARNADNCRWLLEKKYAGRKAIVWAHNAHVMNAYYEPGFKDVRLDGRAVDMKPTGVFLSEWLGEKIYTIGMTSFEGQDGFATASAKSEVIPAPGGSLEARLHALGHAHVFLPLGAGEGPHHPLDAPLSVRIPKYDSVTVSGLRRAYDAILYIDRMSPATRLRA